MFSEQLRTFLYFYGVLQKKATRNDPIKPWKKDKHQILEENINAIKKERKNMHLYTDRLFHKLAIK